MNPEAIERAADHLSRFYHEQPDAAEAGRDAQNMLRTDQLEAARDALAELLAAELPDGTIQGFVRRHANRLAHDDAHARAFLEEALEVLEDELRDR